MNIALVLLPSGKVFQINKEIFSIGRSRGNDLIIHNKKVSRKHCIIKVNKTYCLMEDLHSKNGTYLNGKLIKHQAKLENNDSINISYNGPLLQFRMELDQLSGTHIKKPAINRWKRRLLPAAIVLFLLLLLLIDGIVQGISSTPVNEYDRYHSTIKKEFQRLMLLYGEDNFSLEENLTDAIGVYIEKYENSRTFHVGLQRRQQYIGMIETVFSDHNIPIDLSFIAFIESNYDPMAYNRRSGARGMWQLMPRTARQYGLVVNRRVDQRVDPEKSTEAAAEYINDLLAIFGVDSFLLAIAAYNTGDGSLRASLRKIDDPDKDRSFWYLYNNNLLPDETKEYVIKVIAVILLSKNPDIVKNNWEMKPE